MSRPDLLARAGRLPGSEWARRNRRIREFARRTGFEPPNPRPAPPPRPVGVKLELTYSCNLRCSFCYTDSPRRTLERATDMSDADWWRVVEEAIDVGVIEAVVTGGEALLRKELALEMLERFDGAGVAATLSTNGWFIDEAVADRLAALQYTRVNVSLDGPTPETHDRSRGVPGSWRRAVQAISLLLERSVNVRVVHVVTDDNQALLPELIEQVRTLGVPVLRITPVISIGAAARGRKWKVRIGRIRREIDRARDSFGDELAIRLDRDTLPADPVLAPAYLVVRPNGALMSGGISPFRFGHALEEGLGESWERICRDWQHPRLVAWRAQVLAGTPLDEMPVVVYRDDEIDFYAPAGGERAIVGSAEPRPTGESPPLLPKLAAATQVAGHGDLVAADAHVRQLALDRGYRLAAVRWTPAARGRRYVRTSSGEVTLLNATAATVMDACASGTPGSAVAALRQRYPRTPPAQIERDALDTARRLLDRGVLELARQSRDQPRESETAVSTH